MSEDKKAADAVLRLANIRWPAARNTEIGPVLRRAAKAKDLSGTLAEYLRTLSRGHDLIATALRLAARAADGEDVGVLADEDITRPEMERLRHERGQALDALSTAYDAMCAGIDVHEIQDVIAHAAPSRSVRARGDDTDLLALVRDRLGPERDGASCIITVDAYGGDGAGKVEVRWRRVYADGVCSGQRWAGAATVEEALRAVLAHEDAADEREPEHAGAPPADGRGARANVCGSCANEEHGACLSTSEAPCGCAHAAHAPRPALIVQQPTLAQRMRAGELAAAFSRLPFRHRLAALRWHATKIGERDYARRTTADMRRKLHADRLIDGLDPEAVLTDLGRAVLACLPSEEG